MSEFIKLPLFLLGIVFFVSIVWSFLIRMESETIVDEKEVKNVKVINSRKFYVTKSVDYKNKNCGKLKLRVDSELSSYRYNIFVGGNLVETGIKESNGFLGTSVIEYYYFPTKEMVVKIEEN